MLKIYDCCVDFLKTPIFESEFYRHINFLRNMDVWNKTCYKNHVLKLTHMLFPEFVLINEMYTD